MHVIDDDAALRGSLEVLLEMQGIKAHCYGSAEEFGRNAAPLPIDCLIIDIDLPDASGIGLLDKLRTAGIVTPAIFLTGRRITDDIRSAAQRLRAEVFEKPMLPQEFLIAVRHALG